MPRRIDLGRAVLLGGAALLFISLFLRWYDTGPTGWQVFETLDLVLAALALGGAYVALAPEPPRAAAAFGPPVGAVVIVLVQLLNAPPAAGDGRPAIGAWLALAGAVAMLVGVVQSLTGIAVTVEVGERRVRRRVAAVDLRGDELAAEPPAPASDDRQRTESVTSIHDGEGEDRPIR